MQNRRIENQGVWVEAMEASAQEPKAWREPMFTPGMAELSSLSSVFSFPLQMLFDKSNYTNFLPCGLSFFFFWT